MSTDLAFMDISDYDLFAKHVNSLLLQGLLQLSEADERWLHLFGQNVLFRKRSLAVFS
jgi:hypothetical protein